MELKNVIDKMIAVNVSTGEEVEQINEMLKGIGIDHMGCVSLAFTRHGKKAAFRLTEANGINWKNKAYYTDMGYEIIPASQFLTPKT